MKHLNSLSAALIGILLISPGMVRGQVPDDIDRAKYDKIAQDSGDLAHNKRASANMLLSQAQGTQQALDSKKSALSQNEGRIATNNARILALSQEIPGLEAQNQRLANDIGRLRQDINTLESRLNALKMDYDSYAASMNRESADRDLKIGYLRELNQEIEVLRHQILKSQRELARNQKRFVEINVEIEQKTNRLATIDTLMAQLSAAIPGQEAAAKSARALVAGLKQKADALKADLLKKEADAQPARDRLNASKNILDGIDRQIAELKTRIEVQTKNVTILSGGLKGLEDLLSKAQSDKVTVAGELTKSQDRIKLLEGVAAPLQARNIEITKRTGEISSRVKVLAKIEKDVERDLKVQGNLLGQLEKQPVSPERDAKIAAAKAQIEKLAAELQVASDEHTKLTAEKSTIEAELARNNAAISQNTADLRSEKSNLVTLQAKLVDASKKVDELPGQITAAQAKLATANQYLAASQGELASKRNEQRSAKADVDAQVAALKSQEDAILSARTLFQAAAKDHFAAEDVAAKAEATVADSRRKVSAMTVEQGQIASQLQEFGREIAQMEKQNKENERELPRLSHRLERVARDRDSLQAQIEIQEGVIVSIQRRLNEIGRIIQIQTDERSRLLQILVAKENQLNSNANQITSNRQSIQQFAAEIAQLSQVNQILRQEIPAFEQSATMAWNAHRIADADAAIAEQIAATTQAKAQQVRNAYNRELSAAKEQGTSQGLSLGAKDGDIKGRADGRVIGAQDGDALGRSEGLKYGFDLGQSQGGSKGQSDGYQHGLNSADNYDSGYKPGYAQGAVNAKEKAKLVYADTARNLKASLLERMPNRSVELDNQTSLAPSVSNKVASGDLAGFSARIAQRLAARGEVTQVAGLIDDRNAGGDSQSMRIVQTYIVGVAPDLSLADCKLRYVDFVTACEQSFSGAYIAYFDQAYKSGYNMVYTSEKESARAVAFNANKNVRFKEGYDSAYAREYAAWDKVGAQEATDKGYNTGLIDGEAQAKDAANAEAKANAVKDVNQYFASNPVVRITGADLLKMKSDSGSANDVIVAGDTLALRVTFKNVGQKSSAKGQVQVRLEALTSNIATESVVAQVVSLPEDSLAIVTNVGFAKILAGTGMDVARLRMTATFPDGQTDSRVLEVQTQLFIFADVAKDMNLNPGVGGFFSPNETIELKISNTTAFAGKENFKAVLSIPSMPGIALKEGEAKVGTLKSGEAKTVKLKYKIGKEAKGQDVPLVLTVYYGSRVSWTEKVIVRIKK